MPRFRLMHSKFRDDRLFLSGSLEVYVEQRRTRRESGNSESGRVWWLENCVLWFQSENSQECSLSKPLYEALILRPLSYLPSPFLKTQDIYADISSNPHSSFQSCSRFQRFLPLSCNLPTVQSRCLSGTISMSGSHHF